MGYKMADINTQLLGRIDALQLSARNQQWKQAMKASGWKLFADREKWTVASWHETEGEDIQIRRAKLFKKIVENIEIRIHDYDVIVGRLTPGVIGCATAFDVCGDYIPNIWKDTDEISITMNANVGMDPKSIEILRNSAREFRGKTAPEMTYKAWEAVVGSWIKDAEAAKIKDPTLDSGIFGQTTSVLMWEKILGKGLRSFIDEAQRHIDTFIANRDTNIDKLYFWKSAIIVCEAAVNHARRYAALARKMAEAEMRPDRKAELLQIASVCEHVPENPARTFHEALQSMAIVGVCKNYEHPMHNHPQWGRGDQYLYPYFIQDINSGIITLEKAAELLAELIGRWGTQTFVSSESTKESHQINFGINNAMIGGVDKSGADCSNELSYLFLHVIGLLQLSSPTLGLRWNKATPHWLMNKAIRTNVATKGGIPLFENDEVVISHFLEDGIPVEEAAEWCGLGCVYPCLPSRAEHYGAEGVAACNMAAMLHLVFHNGVDVNGRRTGLETGDPREFKNFDALYSALMQQHRFITHRSFWLAAIARNEQSKHVRLPFLSAMGIQKCMDMGQDLLVPDPESCMFGISDRAIIDVADSLVAVKKLVFDEKKLAMEELLKALDSDFEGKRGEEIRQMCLAQPKFGNDQDEVDLLAKKISEDSHRIIRSYDNSPFRNYMIAREGLAWHYFGGLGVGALPNGRKAFEPLNDGAVSPMRGADRNGPTAVLRSAIKAGFKESHASVLNQKFSAAILRSNESVDKLVAYTNAFMLNGGSHIQYNMVDTNELRDAKMHPENHRDLIVRIGGFSAYFTQLSPSIQDDVINRNEHSL
jgi:pyruvate formate-lyase/glycerol dehydratase family glycyl radical enzyme